MGGEGYEVVRLEEIDELDDGRCPMRPVRQRLGITAFGINAFTARERGDRIINEHDEANAGERQEELYLVLAGHAAFELDGARVDAPAGTFVLVQPDVTRTAFAEAPGTTIVALGGVAGKAYEPSGWELWAPLESLYRAGQYGEAAERARELAAANPGAAGLLYNLACCESLAGLSQDALVHLAQAIEASERFRELAKDDGDFDAVRDDPAFAELVDG